MKVRAYGGHSGCSRAQSAIEYIMTYGWAILIIVIVVALLYSFGVFSPSSSLSQTSTGFEPFTVLSQACSSGGLVLRLGNSAGSSVEIFNASVVGASGTQLSSSGQLNVTLAPQQAFNLVFYNSSCSTLGAEYSANIEIRYGTLSVFGLSNLKAIGYLHGAASQLSELTFTQIGLPSGAQWFVKYAGELKSSSTQSLYFLDFGNERFFISNVTINNVSYYPTVISGISSGSSLAVDFIPLRDMFVANGGSGTLAAISTAINKIVVNITVSSNPIGVALTPDGRYAYVTNHGNSLVSVVDTDTNRVINNVSVGTNPVGVAVNFAGTIAYATALGGGGVLTAINISTSQLISSTKVGGAPSGIAISPASSYIYITQTTNNSVVVVNPATLGVVAAIPVGSDPTSVAVSADGRVAYVTNNVSDTVSAINTSTFKVVKNISVGSGPYSLAISPDSEVLYVANSLSNDVYVINTSTYNVITQISVGSKPVAIAVNPNNQFVYVSNYNSGTVSVISTSSYSVVSSIIGVKNPNGIADAPSGSI